jgi:hypothetical protein
MVSTARRQTQLRSSSSVDSETNSSQEIPAGNSFVNIPLKRTFKGDGTAIWSEFIRYFENVANLNQWTEQRTRRILLATLGDQA